MSSKRHQRRKQCQGKVRYSSKQAAQEVANRLWPARRLRPYECSFCGGWHNGHMNETSRGDARRNRAVKAAVDIVRAVETKLKEAGHAKGN